MHFLFLLVLALVRSGTVRAETGLTGQLLDQATHRPLGYVSVGVVRQPIGTVADGQGRFTLNLPASYDADSVRFSLLGYATRTLTVAALRQQLATGPLLLMPQPVPLREARVLSPGLRRRELGNFVKVRAGVIQGFDANLAGNQFGQRIAIKRPAFLEEVAFGLTYCTYDTVYFRLNVYRLRDDFPAENLLPRPVYLRVSRAAAQQPVTVDLRAYSLWLTEDVVVALELVRPLGKGTLCFASTLLGGPVYELSQSPGPGTTLNTKPRFWAPLPTAQQAQPGNGPWVKHSGIGLCLAARVLQVPSQSTTELTAGQPAQP